MVKSVRYSGPSGHVTVATSNTVEAQSGQRNGIAGSGYRTWRSIQDRPVGGCYGQVTRRGPPRESTATVLLRRRLSQDRLPSPLEMYLLVSRRTALPRREP